MGDRPAPRPGVDPLFTDDDVDELLDFIDWEDSIHGPCGVPKADGFDPASEGEWEATPLRCHACAAIDERMGDFGPNGRGGLFFSVERRK